MTVKEAIETRRSVRHFTGKDIGDEACLEMIEAARKAPSAHNRQNWKFMILGGGRKDAVAGAMLSFFDGNPEPPHESKTSKVTAQVVKNASRLIVCLKEHDESWNRADTLSYGAAIEHMILRATEMGLGTLWILDTCYTEDKILSLLGMEGHDLVGAVAVGEPVKWPKERPRKELGEIVIG